MAALSLDIEAALWAQDFRQVAGVDEAGRGCLAGPVVAAAVILPPGMTVPGVNDSKKLSAGKRDEAAARIKACAAATGTGICSPQEIDKLNILWAAMEAMRRAVINLTLSPDFLLIDGPCCFPDSPWPFRTIIKGDSLCQSIAAASIIAKTTRDRLMQQLHETYPEYGWSRNFGYPTRAHYEALEKHGPTPFHRKSFRLLSR